MLSIHIVQQNLGTVYCVYNQETFIEPCMERFRKDLREIANRDYSLDELKQILLKDDSELFFLQEQIKKKFQIIVK